MPPSQTPIGVAVEVSTEDVVISGVSGRLPESDNVEEFRQHLINKEDMVTEDDRRWTPGEDSQYFETVELPFSHQACLVSQLAMES